MLKNIKKICLLRSDIISEVKLASGRVFRWSTESLLRHILLVLAIGLVCFTVLGALWAEAESSGWSRLWANWRHLGVSQEHADRVKLSLTAVGGLGGTVYLVIKYRERDSIESSEEDIKLERIEEKILRAVQQLGSESPQVRIAGVYALTEVADTHRGNYRQRVVDLLCGYLRTERGSWDANTGSYVNNDSALEDIVLNVISRHMRKEREKSDRCDAVIQKLEDEQLWCDCAINLRGAVITERVDFSNLCFGGSVDFRLTVFNGEVDFHGSRFADIDLSGSQFLEGVNFANGEFRRLKLISIKFGGSNSRENVNFHGAIFREAEFCDVDFGARTSFDDTKFLESTFKDIYVNELTFSSGSKTTFLDAYFENIEIAKAAFLGVIFDGRTLFKDVTFKEVLFRRSTFKHFLTFEEVHFKEKALFKDVTFNEVDFRGAYFHGWAFFGGSKFEQGNNLSEDNFLGRDPEGLTSWPPDEDSLPEEGDS